MTAKKLKSRIQALEREKVSSLYDPRQPTKFPFGPGELETAKDGYCLFMDFHRVKAGEKLALARINAAWRARDTLQRALARIQAKKS